MANGKQLNAAIMRTILDLITFAKRMLSATFHKPYQPHTQLHQVATTAAKKDGTTLKQTTAINITTR